MDKLILKTFTSTNNPELTGASVKQIWALLANILFKNSMPKMSQDKIVEKWEKSIGNKNYSFERSNISKSPYIKQYDNEEIIVDFKFLKDLENKIKNSEKEALEYIHNEISKDIRILKLVTDSFVNDLCEPLNHILSNSSEKESFFNKSHIEILTVDIELIEEFFEKNNIQSKYTTVKEKNYDEIIKEAKTVFLYQEQLTFFEVLEENFIDIKTSLIKGNEKIDVTFSKENFNESFKKLEEYNNIDPLLLKGTSGSGKSLLSLKLCLQALDNNYYAKFIPIFENTDLSSFNIKDFIEDDMDQKLFIVFDGIHYLKDNEINYLIDKVKEDFSSSIFLLTYNPEKIKNIKIKNKLNRDYNSIEIQPQEHDFLKTPLDQIIFEQLKRKLDNVYDLYYAYINKIIEESASELNYSILELRKTFQSFAYKTLFGKFRLDFSKFDNDKLFYFFRDNIFTNIENELEYLNFKSELFQKVLASEYILSEHITPEELSFDLEVSDEDFTDFKWKFNMLYIAHFLNNTNKEKINSKKELISGILHHLLQKRYFEKHKEILKLIQDKDLNEKYNKIFKMQLSKNAYNQGDYITSIEQALLALNINSNTENNIKVINHLASCSTDLFLPNISLELTKKAFKISNDTKEQARVFGNIGRAYIKLNNFDKALVALEEKLRVHESIFNGINDDILRDKCDLLMIYGLKNELHVNERIALFKNILEEYDNLEKENYISYDVNKSFVYRSLSYSINNDPDIVIEHLKSFDNLKKKDSSSEIVLYFNLAKYYFKTNTTLSEDNFLKALHISEKYNYKAESYLIMSYLYLLTNQDSYKNKSLKYYNELKEEAIFIKKALKESTLNIDLEEEFSLVNVFNNNVNLQTLFLI